MQKPSFRLLLPGVPVTECSRASGTLPGRRNFRRLLSTSGSGLKCGSSLTVFRQRRLPVSVSSAGFPSCASGSVRTFNTGISTRDSTEEIAQTDRQEGLLLERLLPEDCDASKIASWMRDGDVNVSPSSVLVMKSRLGRPTGRVCVLTEEAAPDFLLKSFPPGVSLRIMDRYDVELFVEQCERFVTLSEDLRMLARPEFFSRVVTLTEVPKTYGRREIAEVIREHTDIDIDPRQIVFRFKKHGVQADMVWVVCPSPEAANRVIAKVQELPVPKRVQYGTLFGCAFLWASRASLFTSSPDLDFEFPREDPVNRKHRVFVTGWHKEVGEAEFATLCDELQFYAAGVKKVDLDPASETCGFLMSFHDMRMTKRAMRKWTRLKRLWRISGTSPFLAYPRVVDVHWADEDKYADEDSASDDDFDEPVHY